MAEMSGRQCTDGLSEEPPNYDQAIMAQQRQIEEEICMKQEYLVSQPMELSALVEEYSHDHVFLAKVETLRSKFKTFRRLRADGNCFYRAFGFALFEKVMNKQPEIQRVKDSADAMKTLLIDGLGYQDLTVMDFYDTFVSELEALAVGGSVSKLEDLYNDIGRSNYLVVFLRLIVSAYLQKEQDHYVHFLENASTIKDFCNKEVEPMDQECDHLQVIAMSKAMDICIQLEYMDRSPGAELNSLILPEGGVPELILLYRPGHYDILCPSAD